MMAAVAGSGRRQRKKLAVRARLVEEAQKLIENQGFWAATVEQIAASADVAPATFFNYFPNKRAILKELGGPMFSRFAELLVEQRQRDCTTRERLVAFFEAASGVIQEARQTMGEVLLMATRQVISGEGGVQEMEQLRRSFSALIYEGQVRGDVRADVDANFLAEMVAGSFAAALTAVGLEDPRFPLHVRIGPNRIIRLASARGTRRLGP